MVSPSSECRIKCGDAIGLYSDYEPRDLIFDILEFKQWHFYGLEQRSHGPSKIDGLNRSPWKIYSALFPLYLCWIQVPEIGLEGVQPPFLPSNFRQPSMTFQVSMPFQVKCVFYTAYSSQTVHQRCNGRVISKYSIAANIRRKCYAATTDTVVLILLMYR